MLLCKKKRGDNMSDDRKIEVVNGNGDDLEISPVYDHLDIEKPNTEKKKEIVIPKAKKKEEDNDEDDSQMMKRKNKQHCIQCCYICTF